MKKILFDLLALQDVDMKIRGLKTRLAMIPKERENFEKELAAALSSIKAKQEQIKNVELNIRKTESEIAKYDESVKKLQTNSALVKKNNEYQAMLSEIEHNKEKISNLETDLLKMMDRVEAMRKSLKEEERQSAAKIKSIKEELNELVVLEREIKEQGRALLAKSKEFATHVVPDLLDQYNRLLKDSGIPAVKLNGEICDNCNFKVTPQTRNNCRSGNIVFCDNCSHMLYCEKPEQD